MFPFFNKTKDVKGKWRKISDLTPGLEIAVPSENGNVAWDEITSIKPVGREQVYDIEVEGTHNFVGDDIFAHNTYVLKSGNLSANAPSDVLNADDKSVDIYKLATYALSEEQSLAAKVDAEQTEMVSLEARVEALETGSVSSGGNFGTGTLGTGLANALNGFGVLIQKGIAQFNTLVFQRLVAATDSTGASSAGSVSILTGNVVAQVTNSLVMPSTKVFITFNSQITGSWWVSDKATGSFRVVLSTPQASDVSFDYFLVQTEGQISTSTAAVSDQQTNNNSSVTTAPIIVENSSAETSDTTATTTATSTPESSDTTPPVVTLIGEAAIQINVGGTFTDPGATATDPVDGDVTSKIVVTGSVNTATPGLYTLTYSASNAAGNTGTVSRVVTVLAPAETPAPADGSTNSPPDDTTAPTEPAAPAPETPTTPAVETPVG
ncbi:MAG: DUF5011 domain-containing protein [Candidatus Kaiserbacteria bacterium]|nr:DUF5011 domain-containing protein [Candidatus Kaiserbacteria bacterium]